MGTRTCVSPFKYDENDAKAAKFGLRSDFGYKTIGPGPNDARFILQFRIHIQTTVVISTLYRGPGPVMLKYTE